jgi:hypothetical protein
MQVAIYDAAPLAVSEVYDEVEREDPLIPETF